MSEVATRLGFKDGLMVVERIQDVDPILRQVKELAGVNHGRSASGEMHHAARLPMVMVEKYCNDKGVSFRDFMGNPEHVKAMLNDPALASFRVWQGRV